MDSILPPNSAFYHNILDETSVETLLNDRRMSSFLGNLQQISYLASYSMEIFDNLIVLAQDTSDRIELIKLKTNNLRNRLLPEAIKRSALIDIGYGHNGLKAKERYLHETDHIFIPTVLTRDCLPPHLLEQYNKCNHSPSFSDIKHNMKYSNPDLFFKEWIMTEKARQVKAKKDKKKFLVKKKLKIKKPKRDYNKNIINKKNDIETKSSIVTSFLNALKGYVDTKNIDANTSKEISNNENTENTYVNEKSGQINNTRQSTFGNISNSLRKASMFGNMFRASTITNTLGTINEDVMNSYPFDDTDSSHNFGESKTQGGEHFSLYNSLNILSNTLNLNSALSTNQKNGKQKKRQSVLVNNITSVNMDEQLYSTPIIPITSAPPGRDEKSKKLKRLLRKKNAIKDIVQDNAENSLRESNKLLATVEDVPNLKTRRRSSLAQLFTSDAENKAEQPKLLLGNARASATRRSSFNHELINSENIDAITYDISAKKKAIAADINYLHEANITTARRISTSHIMNINIFDIPYSVPSNALINNKLNKDNMIPRPEVDEFKLPFNSSRRSVAVVKLSSTKRLSSVTPPKRTSIKNTQSSAKSDTPTPESIGPPPSDDLSIDDSLPPPDDEDDLEPPPPTPDNEDDLEPPPPTPDNEDDLEPPPPTPRDDEDDLPLPPSTSRDDEDDLPPPIDYKSHPPRRSLFAAIQKSSIEILKETNNEDQPRDSTINKRSKLLLEISNGKQELRKRNESSIVATSAGRKSISNQNVAIAAILANRSKIAGSDSDDSSISSDISDL